MRSDFWTLERVAELRRLLAGRMMATAIARLWGVSRNTVRGKMDRLGLEAGNERHGRSGRPDVRIAATREKPVPPTRPQAPVQPVSDIDPTDAVTMMELGAKSCRWPYGDPRDSDFHFCGHGTDATGDAFDVYCPQHMRKAHQPATGQQAKRYIGPVPR